LMGFGTYCLFHPFYHFWTTSVFCVCPSWAVSVASPPFHPGARFGSVSDSEMRRHTAHSCSVFAVASQVLYRGLRV
jgi:hypothetical protein